jgi:hypothetical protein
VRASSTSSDVSEYTLFEFILLSLGGAYIAKNITSERERCCVETRSKFSDSDCASCSSRVLSVRALDRIGREQLSP